MDGARVAGSRSTEDMLGEIECGAAADLVSAVRNESGLEQLLSLGSRTLTSATPFGPVFLPDLDEKVLKARPHPGDAALRRGDLMELIGPSGSGKTTFLIFLLMTTVLPVSLTLDLPRHLVVRLGGRNQHATLLLPVTHRVPVLSLMRAMRSHILSCVQSDLSTGLPPTDPAILNAIDEAVRQALSRLNIIKVKPRWKNWALALRAIVDPPRLHLDPSEYAGRDHGMSLVVCDGFGDAFYPERWADEDRGKRRRMVGPRSGDDVGMRDVMELVGRLRHELGAVVVLSTQGLWKQGQTPFFAPHLPPPYPMPYAHRDDTSIPPREEPIDIQITMLGRTRRLQLPADTTLVDAMRVPQDSRAQRFEGVLRMPGCGGLAGGAGGDRFSWRIGEEGLEAWATDHQ